MIYEVWRKVEGLCYVQRYIPNPLRVIADQLFRAVMIGAGRPDSLLQTLLDVSSVPDASFLFNTSSLRHSPFSPPLPPLQAKSHGPSLEFCSPQEKKTPHNMIQEKADQDIISCTLSRKPFDALLLFEGSFINSFTHSMADFSSLAIFFDAGSVQAKSTINHWIRSSRFAPESGDVR
jgi:hypothetical protein